jgi:hypothetical protein
MSNATVRSIVGDEDRQSTNSTEPVLASARYWAIGESSRQNGPSSSFGLGGTLAPLLTRQTRLERPSASEEGMPSLGALCVA